LLAADFTVPEPVHKHIPAGLTLFAGAPKAGKSTFMEWLAYEVALHDPVIYLALEYSPPMAQQRFRWMADSRLKMRLFTQAQAPRMGEGGDAWLDRLLTKIQPRLVVIDTLARFKRQADQKGYEAETDAMAELAALFNRHETSAVIIHHTRKGGQNDDPDNPFEKMLGSTALAAVPDNLIVLEGADGKTVLHTRGRMISQRKDVFELRGHRFELNTEPGAILAGKADVQASILNFLADGPATQKEIVEALGLRQGHVSNYIKKLSAARLLKRGPPVELIDQGAGLF
jgi:RecA-family ATPase